MRGKLEIERTTHSKWIAFRNSSGWFIGLASILIAVYLGFFKKDEPELEYEILSYTNFINQHETAAKLKIYIDSLDVQRNHLNISAFTIKVQNQGTDNIRYDDYDKGFFGLKIKNGQLLESPILLDVSTEHIRKLYPKNDSVISRTEIHIPNISLDKDDYYVLRVVLLHNINEAPSFTPVGKIIGQKEINIKQLQAPVPDMWETIWVGSLWVHLIRFIFYIFIIPAIVFIIVLPVIFVSNFIERRKRKQIVKEVTMTEKLLQLVKNDFLKEGSWVIDEAHSIFNKQETEITTQFQKSKRYLSSLRAKEQNNYEARYIHKSRISRIDRMIDKGYLIQEENDIIAFNKDAKQSVDILYSKLKDRGMLPEHRDARIRDERFV